MKKTLLFLPILLILFACNLLAQPVDNILVMDNGMAYIDAYTGDELLAGETFTYRWYAVSATIAVDYQNPAELELIAETTIPQAPFDFPPNPRITRYLGCGVHVTALDGTETDGPITWSFDATPGAVHVDMGGTFAIGPTGGVILFTPLAGMRVQ